jgi:hypothetical protein
MEDLLHIISQSEEIAWIQLIRNEEKILNNINCDKNGRLQFYILETNGKIKKRIQTREEKIFVLANDGLSGDSVIHEMTLNQVPPYENSPFICLFLLTWIVKQSVSVFTGCECNMLQWKQNCSLHERVLHFPEEVHRVNKFNGSSKMSAPKAVG